MRVVCGEEQHTAVLAEVHSGFRIVPRYDIVVPKASEIDLSDFLTDDGALLWCPKHGPVVVHNEDVHSGTLVAHKMNTDCPS